MLKRSPLGVEQIEVNRCNRRQRSGTKRTRNERLMSNDQLNWSLLSPSIRKGVASRTFIFIPSTFRCDNRVFERRTEVKKMRGVRVDHRKSDTVRAMILDHIICDAT